MTFTHYKLSEKAIEAHVDIDKVFERMADVLDLGDQIGKIIELTIDKAHRHSNYQMIENIQLYLIIEKHKSDLIEKVQAYHPHRFDPQMVYDMGLKSIAEGPLMGMVNDINDQLKHASSLGTLIEQGFFEEDLEEQFREAIHNVFGLEAFDRSFFLDRIEGVLIEESHEDIKEFIECKDSNKAIIKGLELFDQI